MTMLLETALDISREMLRRIEDRDWDGIAELQTQRMALLTTRPLDAADGQAWLGLVELNRQLLDALRETQAATLADMMHRRRQKRAALAYHRP